MNPHTTKHYAALRIKHLADRVAHFENQGDLVAASVFADYLVDALDHFTLHDTHVVVGDHDPEPRVQPANGCDGYYYPDPEPRAHE